MHSSFSPEASLIKWERQHNVKLGEGSETGWNDESSQWTSVVIQEGKLTDEIFHVRLATMRTSHSTAKHSGTHKHLNKYFSALATWDVYNCPCCRCHTAKTSGRALNVFSAAEHHAELGERSGCKTRLPGERNTRSHNRFCSDLWLTHQLEGSTFFF